MATLVSSVGDFFGHPFVVVVIGALLSGLVVNYVTHRWQERQREREVKTDLVAKMSESVHTLTMSVLFVHQAKKHQSDRPTDDLLAKRQEDLEVAYRDWRVRSAVIGAKLEAFFLGTCLRDEWSNFSKAVNLFYQAENARTPKEEKRLYAKLQEILPPSSKRDAAESELGDALSEKEDEDWVDAKDRIGQRTSSLVKKVLGSQITRLGHSFRWRPYSR